MHAYDWAFRYKKIHNEHEVKWILTGYVRDPVTTHQYIEISYCT